MIIAVAGYKGGAGKTTTAASLAAEHHRRGRKVLLVDADPQGTSTTWHVLAAELKQPTPTLVAMGATMHREDQLPQLARGFDLVIIDGPPRHGDVQRSMMLCADLVLLPCNPSTPDVWAVTQSVALVEETRSTLRPNLQGVVLLNRVLPRTTMTTNSREELRKCGLLLLSSELGQRTAFPEAFAAGQGVTTYEPEGRAASEVMALADELERVLPRRGVRRGR